MKNYQQSTRVLKMLAHPTRLRLLDALRNGEECVCHLTALLKQRQAYVSQQLMFLRQAGLLVDRKDGARVYYRVKDARIFDLLTTAHALAGETSLAIESKTLAACSCPKCETDRERKSK